MLALRHIQVIPHCGDEPRISTDQLSFVYFILVEGPPCLLNLMDEQVEISLRLIV